MFPRRCIADRCLWTEVLGSVVTAEIWVASIGRPSYCPTRIAKETKVSSVGTLRDVATE